MLLHRYIIKTIFYATCLVISIIVGVLFLLKVISEMKNVGQGDYNSMHVLLYVTLRLPGLVYQFSPLIILLGCIIGLSMLTSYRELSVMRSSGFSVTRIIFSVLSAGLILITLMSGAGELFSPDLSYKAEINKENARNAGAAVVTNGGVWFHVNNNFIYVRQMIGRQLLKNVTRYEFDDNHELKTAYFAKQLNYVDGNWSMHEVVKTTFTNGETTSEALTDVPWDIPFNLNLLNLGLIEANEMSLTKLSQYANYLRENGLQASNYQYNFWQRIMQPLASLIMILLAIPFVLSTFSQATMGWRIVLGILMGFMFFIMNSFLGQLSVVFQIPPALAATLPVMVFAIIGIILNKRMIKR
jgi:lipopolysaccharide export system permease protein